MATAGNTVSVVLRERLNSSTVYYYTVSAVSGDVTVVVRVPPFITAEYGKQLAKCTCLYEYMYTAIKPAFLLQFTQSALGTASHTHCINVQ